MTSAPPAGDRPRVCFLAYHLSPNDARFLKLRDTLRQNGFETTAIAPALAPLEAGVDAVRDGPVSRLAHRWRRHPALARLAGAYLSFRRTARLARQVAKHRPDLLVVFDPEALPAAVRAKALTGAKLIFDAHEYHADEAPDQPARGRWVARVEQRCGPHLDGFMTVNASIAALYARDGRITRPATIVRNCVDPYPAATRPGLLRAALGLGAEARILLYHGALQRWRGLDDLAAIARLLPAPWTVAVMGDGPLRDALQAEAPALRFLGPVPHAELPDWVSSATLGAVLYEGVGENQRHCLPNKIWEFAAAGVPVIARALPEIEAALHQSGGGWLAGEDETPGAIAGRLARLTPDALAEAGRRAREYARRNSWHDEAAGFVSLCRSLTPLAPRP